MVVAGGLGDVEKFREATLRAAGDGRWSELAALAERAGGGWVLACRGEELFVCGDSCSAHAVFYASTASGVVWSTSIRQLAEEVGAAVDLLMMAAQMAVGPEHWPGRTLYKGVQQAPGGSGFL